MSNKFLTRQTAGLDDGTADLYVGSIRLNNIDVSKNLKTDPIGQIVAENVSISEVDGLQTELDFKLNKTVATFSTQPSTPTTPPVGDFKMYAKDDKKLYTLDSDGLETQISLGSNPFNQNLNTTNSVEFASIKDNQHNLTLGLNLTPLTNCVQLGGNTVAPTRGTGCTVVGFDAARNVGDANTVIGNSALFLAAASGDNNVVVGSRIGVGGAIGSDNTIVGDFTVFTGCGTSNVAIGKHIAMNTPLVNNILAINAGGSGIDPVGSNKIILQGGTSTFTVDAFGAQVNGTPVQIPDQNLSTTSSPSFLDLSHKGNLYFDNLNDNIVYHQQSMTFTGTGTKNISMGFKTTQPSLNSAFKTVSIGYDAGLSSFTEAVALGWEAGKTAQGLFATAVGSQAGLLNQSQGAAAFGHLAGSSGQSLNAVAVGNLAGQTNQGLNAIALGKGAGSLNQGSDSICIGNDAGTTFADSIIIKAKTTTISNATASNQYNIIAGTTELIGDSTSMRPNTNVDVGANFVLSTGVPTLNEHLANKLYVDTGLNAKLSLSGGTMTGNITTLRTNDSRIVLGLNAGVSSGINSVCVGFGSNSGGQDSVAAGASSSASGGSSIAIGNTASASSLGSIAVGVNAVCSGNAGIAIGREAKALNTNSIVFNSNAGTLAQSTANNQIIFVAGTTQFQADANGFVVAGAIPSTSTTTGSLQCKGGLGVLENINFGGLINGLTAGGGMFAQTNTITVANTTVETSIVGSGQGSLSVPANTFTVGTSCVLEAGGVMSCLNNETLIIRIYCGVGGATLLGTLPTLTIGTSSGRWFGLACYFTIRAIGGAGVGVISVRAVYQQNIDVGNELYGTSFHTVNNTTFDTTIINTLRITIQWGSASASNTLSNAQLVLTRSY